MGQVLVLGLIGGSIYALFALGVVLVHRGTGVLTFANGEVGTASLFVAAFLVDRDVPWVVAAAAALLFATLLGALFEFAVVRRMVDADPVTVAVATVGFGLLLLSIEIVRAGQSPKSLPGPFTGNGLHIAGVIVSPTQLIALVLALLLAFGLQTFLRRTDFGLGMLAAAQDKSAVRLVGAPLSRITMAVWGAGAALAAIASLLVEPTVGVFVPGYASELYLFGLAAAVVGGLNSLPGAFFGGIALGIIEVAVNRYIGTDLPGLRYVVALSVMLLALLGRQFLPDLQRRFAVSRPAEAVAA